MIYLFLTTILILAFSVYREILNKKIIDDLMDRAMSKDIVQYKEAIQPISKDDFPIDQMKDLVPLDEVDIDTLDKVIDTK